MKKVLAFDLDDTLNVAKTPITNDVAELLTKLLNHFEICPISGQKFEQFLVQIVNPILETGASAKQLKHLHLLVAQGTQYYRYESERDEYDEKNWKQVYSYPLSDEQLARMGEVIEKAAKATGNWEETRVAEDDQIIENRVSQITFSALGQKAGSEEKYAWDPDHKKREAIVAKCKEIEPEFDYEIAGTTSINVFLPGRDKVFGMNHLMEELNVEKDDILYFGDMTQKGGNDYPVVQMGIETISVRNYEDTAFALRGILETIE